VSGKGAAGSAAGVVGTGEQRAVGKPHGATGKKLGDASCTVAICGTRRRRRRLNCDCSGRWGKQPGSRRGLAPRNWRSETRPVTAWATASAISSASVTLPAGPGRGIDSEQAKT
jgi:hypothetical protein